VVEGGRMKYSTKIGLLYLVLFISSCSTLDIRTQYSHLDLKKWDRTADCCEANGKQFAISSGGKHSTECGKRILASGGNIVDASVATAFCLAVERPHSVSIAGGGFMLISLAKPNPKTIFVDFRETAPAAISPKLFQKELDKDGNGLLVATPGLVAGLFKVQKKYGALKGNEGWMKTIQPAIELAEKGFLVYPSLSEKIEIRKEGLSKDEYLQSLFLPNHSPLKIGDLLVQKDLAKTLRKISEKGPRAIYEGEIAKFIVERVTMKKGVLSLEDLKRYRPKERTPLKLTVLGKTLMTAPPPSSGGIQVLQILKAMGKTVPDDKYLIKLSKVFRTSFSERYVEVADPDFISVAPMKKVDLKLVSQEKSVMKVESPDTTHLSLIDSEGNAVSSTISQNYFFGAAIGVPGTGILLNDQVSDFSLDGKNKMNEPRPRRRPISNMAPTIVFENDRPVLVLGAAGGTQIVTGVSQVILNRFVRGMTLKESIFAPRVHHHFNPDKLFPEKGGFSEPELKKLKDAGFDIANASSYSQVYAVEADPKTGELSAVSEPRDEGGAYCSTQ
jgi:gamma-glutamyltranspeptidase/glutathione hydrolase